MNSFINFDDLFWETIDQTCNISNGNILKQKELLEKELEKFDSQHLILFHLRFSELRLQAYQWNTWLAYETIIKETNEDDFYNFREWIIMQGKNNYYSILENPDLLVNAKKEDIIIAIEILETIGYLPKKILEAKGIIHSIHFQSEIPGDDWADQNILAKDLLPNLWRKYN